MPNSNTVQAIEAARQGEVVEPGTPTAGQTHPRRLRAAARVPLVCTVHRTVQLQRDFKRVKRGVHGVHLDATRSKRSSFTRPVCRRLPVTLTIP